MTPAHITITLAARGVALRAEAGRLGWVAPAGALRPEDKDALRDHREELLAFLLDAQGDNGTHARSGARSEIVKAAARLVNLRQRPSETRPTWTIPVDADGWPLWILQQGAWVRDCLWPSPIPPGEALGQSLADVHRRLWFEAPNRREVKP